MESGREPDPPCESKKNGAPKRAEVVEGVRGSDADLTLPLLRLLLDGDRLRGGGFLRPRETEQRSDVRCLGSGERPSSAMFMGVERGRFLRRLAAQDATCLLAVNACAAQNFLERCGVGCHIKSPS